MHLAYFTNQYPKVSHSFIRREILALENLGHTVERFALRSDETELVDSLDLDEFSKTSHVLSESYLSIILICISTMIVRPIRFLSTFALAVKLGFRSDRGMFRNIAYMLESCVLLNWQRDKNIQHIHAHFGTNSTSVVMFAHLLGGVGYSFTIHGPEEFDKPEFISLAEKVKYSRFVVVISSYGRSQLYRWIPLIQWHKVNIIHCAVDDLVIDVPLQELPEQVEFVSIGRLAEQKGQLLMLEALHKLKLSGVEVKLTLVGDGPLKLIIEQKIIDYGLADNVVITGALSGIEVIKAIDKASILLLPSFAEGLPVVIMEALARCRPVLSTYIAGIPELVVPEQSGWLVPAGDVDTLARKIREVIEMRNAELSTMGKKGREQVLLKHNSKIEAAKLAMLFESNILEAG